ncbi:YadA-like family protein [Enterobacter hormaechei]
MKLNKSILAVAISCVVVSGTAHAAITSVDAARVDVSNSATRLADAQTAYDYAFGPTSTATSSEMIAAKKELREAHAAYDAAKSDYAMVGAGLTVDNQQRTAAQHIDMTPRPIAGIAPTGKPVAHLPINTANTVAQSNAPMNQTASGKVQTVDLSPRGTVGIAPTGKPVSHLPLVTAPTVAQQNQQGAALTAANQQRTATQHIDMSPRGTVGIAPTGKPVNQIKPSTVNTVAQGIAATTAAQTKNASQQIDMSPRGTAGIAPSGKPVSHLPLVTAPTVAQNLQGTALTAANQTRTYAQINAGKGAVLTTANLQRTTQQQGAALTSANQQRTQQQIDALTGNVLTTANQTRTSAQIEAGKGSALTSANLQRTTQQQGAALTVANQQRVSSQTIDLQAANQQRTQAQIDAGKVAAQTFVAQDAQRSLTTEKYAAANAPRDGLDGATGQKGDQGEAGKQGVTGKKGAQGIQGVAGHDGVTTTVTKVQTDTKTQKQVAQNQTDIRHVENVQTTQGEYVQHMNQTVSHNATLAASNSKRLDSVESRQKSLEQQQSNDREEYRAGIAGAVAISGLHYTETDNSLAIGAGDFKNEQGYALGYRHKFSQNVAATVAASETSNGDAMFSASAAIGW